jgi:hypothetical protein
MPEISRCVAIGTVEFLILWRTMMTVAITTLTLHLTPDFLTGLTGSSTGKGGTATQNGVWAYLWNNKPASDLAPSPLLPTGSAANFTPLIIAGQLTSNVILGADNNYNVLVTLTDTASPTVNGGVVYLIVQSENPADHNDLVSLIGSDESLIQPNVKSWHYGYAAFEFSLLGQSADQGDLTAIPGFSQHLAVNISYSDGSCDSRGYNITGASMTSALSSAEPAAVLTYPASTTDTPYSSLDGATAIVFSPSNGNFGSSIYPSDNWSLYLTAFASLTDVTISGCTNGEPDASGIWHNSQYYAYAMQAVQLLEGAWGPAGTYFKFSPNTNSQTRGYMLMSQSTLQENLYAAGQGYATLWQDSELTQPYIIPGSGSSPTTAPTTCQFNPSANNEWGNAFTPLFTGFTAGYWGVTAQQSNPLNRVATNNLAGGTLNLDQTINQSPSYAFDLNRVGTIPTYQHNDAYSEECFNESNVYGSAFSDNLSNGLTPSPLISLSQPGTSTNVGNIDLYAYGVNEKDIYYKKPVGANYLSVQTDYLIPTQTSGLQLIVSGLSAGVLVRSDATIKLGIYLGAGQFTYVPLTNPGNIWQNYNVTGSSGSWAVASGGSNIAGTFIINNLPTPATTLDGQVCWYQLVFSDSDGDQKVFDFYVTATNSIGQIQTSATSLAVDGNASIQANSATQLQLNLNPATSMPDGLLSFEYNAQFSPRPAAPVVGTATATGFTALNGQNGTGLPTSLDGKVPGSAAPLITVTPSQYLQFGWTGTNNGTHTGTPTNPVFSSDGSYTAGLVSEYTNKINAGNIAQINFYNIAAKQTLNFMMQATADLDGQWQTTSSAQLPEGSYLVTMTEMLPDGTAFGPASFPLTLHVAA